MRDLAMGSVSGVIYHQTFNILADSNNSSSNSNFTIGQNATAKFNPSMAIIIIVLISAFLFMGFFSIYVRRCTSSEDNTNANNAQQARSGHPVTAMPAQGLDKSVVENLPLVGYDLVKGLDGGKDLSECAVCLSDFEDNEDLRLLPKCGHVFHPDCIDMWFHSHSTCPLCRASLVPGSEDGKEDHAHSEEFQAWVHNRGTGPEEEAQTIHDGPPVPPNGSMLELLSREGAERILAGSLRRDGERLDPGLARREVDENGERAVEMRALNRALSRNSTSFRKASRGVEVSERIGAASDSARFNPSTAAGAVDGNGMGPTMFEKRERKTSRSVGSSHSFNMALRRSSSLGSSGSYIRQLFGNYTDYFSPDSEQDGLRVDRTRLLGTQHRLPLVNPVVRRERSENELQNLGRVEIPVWDNIDLNEESDQLGTARSPTANRELRRWGSRGLNYPGSAGRKYASAELPLNSGLRRVDLQGEASGPLYVRRKGKESVEERTKSDRWTFGQSLRRTFSLRRTSSDTRDSMESTSQQQTSNESGKWYSQMMPSAPASASKPKKYSPWAGAMKIRRSPSSADVASTPNSPSSAFPQSLPVSDQHQQQQQQQQQQHQQPPAHTESIQIVTQQ